MTFDFWNHGRTRTTLTRGLAAASQFALRAYPTRPLRGGRINVRFGRARSPSAPHIATPGRARSPSVPYWLVTVCSFFALVITSFAVDPGISVEARQRYPWNGLVDVHFTITGDAGTKYDTSFTAKDMVGNTNITMATIRKSNGVAANVSKEQLLPGTYKWVWDAAADLPKDFQCDRVTVKGTAVNMSYSVKFNANGGTGTMANESFIYGTAKALTANAFTRTGYTFQGWATSASGSKVYNDKQSVSNLTTTSGAVVNLYAVWKSALYMVIDLSSGSSSSSYPVSYLDAVPSGGWGNAYKTTKLVLRRVPKGSNPAGGSMTKDMWVGIFEVTVGQYERINNVTPVSTQNKKSAMEYVDGGSRGYGYYGAGNVLSALNTKTVLNKIRLPTRAEWEYACRAGTQTAYNNGTSASTKNMNKVGWWNGNSNRLVSEEVGLKVPNAWGLYDMHGNVEERTSTSWGLMGGTYRSDYSNCTSSNFESPGDSVGRIADGFRVFAEVE